MSTRAIKATLRAARQEYDAMPSRECLDRIGELETLLLLRPDVRRWVVGMCS